MAPLYQKLEEDIRRKIDSNEWKEDMKVPSELEFCEMYGLSRSTVRKAIDSLVLAGYLQRSKGKGTYVKEKKIEQKMSKFYSFSEEFEKRGMVETAKLHVFHIIPANTEVAKNLSIREGDDVYEVLRTRLVNDMVYAVEDSFIPAVFAEGITGEMIMNNGLYRTMRLFHIGPDSATEKLTAVMPNEDVVRYLNIEKNDACMHIRRIAYSSGKPVEYCDSYTKGDMFSYTVELK